MILLRLPSRGTAIAHFLPAHLDPEHEAARLRLLLDGLRLQLITSPRHTSVSWALAILDDHFAALTAGAAAAPAPRGSPPGATGHDSSAARLAPTAP